METGNNQGNQKPSAVFYVLSALAIVVLLYLFGGLFILILPWLGMKALLG